MSIVMVHAATDCKAYAAAGKWDLALSRCELYARLACQGMDASHLYPPALMTVSLEGRLNPKTQWRPSDPVYTTFLRARERLHAGAPTWVCPQLPAFRMYGVSAPPVDSRVQARKDLAARYPEPGMGEALVLYFQGDFATAPVPLQKITEHMSKAAFHEEARRLLNDVNLAINLYENGVAEITADHPERAEAPFLKALALDERLMLGARASTLTAEEKKRELARYESFVRRNIVETMAASTYEKGKALADRKDFRAACRTWKVGLTFSRSNIDLLKALTNVCTRTASELFEKAQACEQLKSALDFAVDGDGFKEKITQSLEQEGCP
jgi:tetratricopeptide (TPR) repeat protein